MNRSNISVLNIFDLPNELLLIICKKLNPADALYSLVDVNQRFDKLLLDSPYIRRLDTVSMAMKSNSNRRISIDNALLKKIREKILPRIHDRLNELIVEEHTMERILLAVDYPQLHLLSFLNFREGILEQHLSGDSTLRRLLVEQITHLEIDVLNESRTGFSETMSEIFPLILTLCQRLLRLNFCQFFPDRRTSIHIRTLSSTSFMSSTLTKLKVNVKTFACCLDLLDGRLNCLTKLNIRVDKISAAFSKIDKTRKLPRLKSSSLISVNNTRFYEIEIVRLLRRMIVLEELTLLLSVMRDNTPFLDGIELNKEILLYVPRLNKFTFSINTFVYNERRRIDFPSNEDIQRTFNSKAYEQVGSYVETKFRHPAGRCHIYSLPYYFEDFLFLNNSFQGGMFHSVRCLIMADISPFEHQFFQIISQDFPFLQELHLGNDQEQEMKEHFSTLIPFPHLLRLDLIDAHMDYLQQFLFHQKTRMPCLVDLSVNYQSLTIVTDNFTSNTARLTCAKIQRIRKDDLFVRSKSFHQYFPLL